MASILSLEEMELGEDPSTIRQLGLRPSNLVRFNQHPLIISMLINEGAILAGGALRAVVDKSTVLDYDLFCKGEAELVRLKTLALKWTGTRKVFECPNNELVTVRCGAFKIQIINVPDGNDPVKLLKSFDIIPSMFALDKGGHLYAHRLAMKCAMRRYVLLGRITYPIATLKRLEKFKMKGYKVGASVYKWLFEHSTDLNDPNMWRTYID